MCATQLESILMFNPLFSLPKISPQHIECHLQVNREQKNIIRHVRPWDSRVLGRPMKFKQYNPLPSRALKVPDNWRMRTGVCALLIHVTGLSSSWPRRQWCFPRLVIGWPCSTSGALGFSNGFLVFFLNLWQSSFLKLDCLPLSVNSNGFLFVTSFKMIS